MHGVKEINRLATNIGCDISSLFSLSTKLVWIFWQIAYAGFGNWWELSNRAWCWLQQSLLQSKYSEDLGHPLELHPHPNTSDTFTIWFVEVTFFSCREEQCAWSSSFAFSTSGSGLQTSASIFFASIWFGQWVWSF